MKVSITTMDLQHRKPEDYFDGLLHAIQKANKYFREFDINASNHTKARNANHAEKFIDLYRTHFHSSLEGLLNTIGALKKEFYYTYNYDNVNYQLMEMEQIMNYLHSNRELFIARIKEATAFVPQASLKTWVDAFEKLCSETEMLQEEYYSIGLDR